MLDYHPTFIKYNDNMQHYYIGLHVHGKLNSLDVNVPNSLHIPFVMFISIAGITLLHRFHTLGVPSATCSEASHSGVCNCAGGGGGGGGGLISPSVLLDTLHATSILSYESAIHT